MNGLFSITLNTYCRIVHGINHRAIEPSTTSASPPITESCVYRDYQCHDWCRLVGIIEATYSMNYDSHWSLFRLVQRRRVWCACFSTAARTTSYYLTPKRPPTLFRAVLNVWPAANLQRKSPAGIPRLSRFYYMQLNVIHMYV